MSGPTFATDLYENGGIEKRNIDIEHRRRKLWKKEQCRRTDEPGNLKNGKNWDATDSKWGAPAAPGTLLVTQFIVSLCAMYLYRCKAPFHTLVEKW